MFDSAKAAQDYIVGGRGILTVRSVRTGVHFTYKISRPSRVDGPQILFVSVLVGRETYRYVGQLGVAEMAFVASRNAPACMATAAKAFAFLVACLKKGALHADHEVTHEGRCGCCGRWITTPSSLAAGIGPECMDAVGGKAPKLARKPVERHPDPFVVAARERVAREHAATTAYWRAYNSAPVSPLGDLLDRFAAGHC